MNFEKSGDSVRVLPLKNIVKITETLSIEYKVGANDSDLLSQENWRAKATARNTNDYDESIEYEKEQNIFMDGYPIYVDHWNNIEEDEFNRLPNQTENRERSKDTNLDHPYSRSIESIDLNSLQSKIKDTSNRNVNKKPAKNINENYRTEGQSNNNNIKRIKMENRESNSVNTAEMEDWKREKTKLSKYFKAFPEIRQINLLNTRNSKKPSLLTNGSLCRRPASINGETFFVKYTWKTFIMLRFWNGQKIIPCNSSLHCSTKVSHLH